MKILLHFLIKSAKFYAAQLFLALEHLHNQDIVYREYLKKKIRKKMNKKESSFFFCDEKILKNY